MTKSDEDKKLGFIEPSDEEQIAIERFQSKGLPVLVPRNWRRLDMNTSSGEVLRRQVIPVLEEVRTTEDDRVDPLGEEELKKAPYVVHRYPNRALFLVTDRCAGYCRFCTRKRWVGQGPTPTKDELSQGVAYIRQESRINDVILSGGDPLTLSNRRILELVSELRSIAHVDIIRLATRILSFDPKRVDEELISGLKAHQPIYWMVHFNHVDELTPEAVSAIKRVADAGFPILNQTVLLKGINDSSESLSALWHRLSTLRVQPYYLHHCDLVTGATHFRVPLDKALQLMDEIRFNLSGISIPQFVIDIPGGLGKVPLTPERIVGRDDEYIYLKGLRGESARYPIF